MFTKAHVVIITVDLFDDNKSNNIIHLIRTMIIRIIITITITIIITMITHLIKTMPFDFPEDGSK